MTAIKAAGQGCNGITGLIRKKRVSAKGFWVLRVLVGRRRG
jgi:hypothetical protein